MLMHLITQKGIFGPTVTHITAIEFQKRGLPHAHILIFFQNEYKLSTVTAVDDIIWARWPDPNSQRHLFELKKKYMLHGPCGKYNRKVTCMEGGKCRFGFPKSFQMHTTLSDDGYPLYFRLNDSRSYEVHGFHFDNRWILSFNPFSLEFMDCHVNCKCAFSFWTTKYLNKYLKKGGDTGTLAMTDTENEIKRYIEGCYFSAVESAWRIFAFETHRQYPTVMRLPVHLPGQETIIFQTEETPDDISQCGSNIETALTAFFAINRDEGPLGVEARQLTYQEFPQHFTLKSYGSRKKWQQQQSHFALGRMVYISPTAGERLYLQMLLTVIRGPKSFADLLHIDGQDTPSSTFHDACIRHGLLEDDGEWMMCFDEAHDIHTGHSLRNLFTTILLFCEINHPHQLWNTFKHSICDDIPYHLRTFSITSFSESNYNYGLYLLNQILEEAGKTLCDFPSMPHFIYNWDTTAQNCLIVEQLDWDKELERASANTQIAALNAQQKKCLIVYGIPSVMIMANCSSSTELEELGRHTYIKQFVMLYVVKGGLCYVLLRLASLHYYYLVVEQHILCSRFPSQLLLQI